MIKRLKAMPTWKVWCAGAYSGLSCVTLGFIAQVLGVRWQYAVPLYIMGFTLLYSAVGFIYYRDQMR